MSSTDAVSDSAPLIGQVKWFNNKAGYGFITVNDGEFAGKDIFIHYSTIKVTNSQYKYLVQGEYVEFTLEKSTTGNHEYQASAVSGIKGGKLMCETRLANRQVGGGSAPAPSGGAGGERPYRRYNNTRQGGDSSPREDGDGYQRVQGKRRSNGGRRPVVNTATSVTAESSL